MFESLQPGMSFAWDLVWQSSLVLALVLALEFLVRFQPARGHRVLVLAMIAALAAPLLSHQAHRLGWGLWSAHRELVTRPAPPTRVDDTPTAADAFPGETSKAAAAFENPARATKTESDPAAIRETRPADPVASIPTVSDLLLAVWLLLSLTAAARLAVAVLSGLRLARQARSLEQPCFLTAARSAVARLGLHALPELRITQHAKCPVIWCWGLRPVVFIPESALAPARSLDWVGILCHELAHWRRGDHLAAFLAEILVCVLPWNPLAWWAKVRLAQLAELACDDWVLASGLPASDYAESLLGLVPERHAALALAAVSRRSDLVSRVRHILDDQRRSPRSGRCWTCLVASLMVLAVAGLALAQARPAVVQGQRGGHEGTQVKTENSQAARQTVRGTVTAPDGKPSARASVFWYGYRKPRVSYAVDPPIMPKGREAQPADREQLLVKGATDAAGRFEFAANLDPGRYFDESRLIVLAEGAGFLSRSLKKGETDVALSLAPEVVIHGRLLTPAGQPAPGARVSLLSLWGATPDQVEFIGPTDDDSALPTYWPRSQTTDREGRFSFHGVPASSYARLSFRHPNHAVDEVTVNARHEGPLPAHLKWLENDVVAATFTHTLEPARPVQGRVTDKATGKPLAGIYVEMLPFRNHSAQTFRTRTDADGHYRISGHQADRYVTRVYPPPDSGLIALSDEHTWPAGARVLEVNFALPTGRLLRGRVIHAETQQPIASAVVLYEPRRGNPNDLEGYNLDSPALTDDQGRFTITGLAGEGSVLVEAPMRDAIRVEYMPGKNEKYAMFPHGFARLDVPEHGNFPPVEIAVRKGVKLEARILGPDGTPVSGFGAYGPGFSGQLNRPYSHICVDFPGDRFFINGADPERTYRVMFTEGSRRLGATVTLKADPARREPLEVKLQPLARVHGKLVGPTGLPVTQAQVYAQIVVTSRSGPFTRQELYSNAEFYSNLLPGPVRSERNLESIDAEGKFKVDMLMPGARLYLTAASGDRAASVPIPLLTPGEDRDLGTLVLQQE